jgi:hypothetical protein
MKSLFKKVIPSSCTEPYFRAICAAEAADKRGKTTFKLGFDRQALLLYEHLTHLPT